MKVFSASPKGLGTGFAHTAAGLPRWSKALAGLFLAVLFMLLPLVLNDYALGLAGDFGIYAILGLSLNIILGHCGLFHMGHSAFFAVGAYSAALLNTMFGMPILWTIPAGGVFAALFALLVVRPIIHLRGDYLLVVTIGIVEIVRIALVNLEFTGGANGILLTDLISILGFEIFTPAHFYYLIFAFLGLSILLFYFLQNSRFGRALNYIKQDELAAEGCGINTAHYKLTVFVLGAFWAGLTGPIFAAKLTLVAPSSFTYNESVLLFAIVILGGAGSIPGVILGAFLIVGLPEIFRDLQNYRLLILGAAMVLMMIFRPKGLIPQVKRHYDARPLLGLFKNALGAAPSVAPVPKRTSAEVRRTDVH